MGLFDKFTKILGSSSKIKENSVNVAEPQNICPPEPIVLLPTSHIVEDEEYGDNDIKYHISFTINDAFKKAKSHAAEVMMLNTYAPDKEYGEEAAMPYIAILIDDDVYCAVEEFKETGRFDGAIDLTPLSRKFFFKAKKEYYGDMMYFYALDRCDGFWEHNGLCLVYPKSYIGTEDEAKLMHILDDVAASYTETKME